MNKFTHFIFYNNTVPIILGVLFLGAGATFAASPEARSAVVDSQTEVASIDNSYLLNTAITDETVGITVVSVTENDEVYFVEYTMTTIEVRDGVWQPVTKTKVLEVGKDSIVGQDLGLYVEQELAELHTFTIKQLEQVQEREQQSGITSKVVATEYSGLVGQFFDPTQEEFPRYNPLISPDVGIPLNKEQEKAHEAVRRLIEEEKKKREEAVSQAESEPAPVEGGRESDGVVEEEIITGDEESTPEEPIPSEVEPIPEPEPVPEQPVAEPEPEPEPVFEAPQTLESIGL